MIMADRTSTFKTVKHSNKDKQDMFLTHLTYRTFNTHMFDRRLTKLQSCCGPQAASAPATLAKTPT
jgi:hypothetical protein